MCFLKSRSKAEGQKKSLVILNDFRKMLIKYLQTPVQNCDQQKILPVCLWVRYELKWSRCPRCVRRDTEAVFTIHSRCGSRILIGVGVDQILGVLMFYPGGLKHVHVAIGIALLALAIPWSSCWSLGNITFSCIRTWFQTKGFVCLFVFEILKSRERTPGTMHRFSDPLDIVAHPGFWSRGVDT